MRNHTPVRILSSKPDEPALIPQKIPLISLWMARTSSNMSPASYSHEGDLIPTWGFTHQNAFSPPEWWVLGYVWDRPHPQVRFFLIPYDGFLIPDEFFFQSSPIRSEVKMILPSLPTWRWELTECLKQKENCVRRLRDVCIVFDMFLFTFHNICLWPLKWFLHVPARRWSYPTFVRTTTFTHRYGCRHAYETWI